MVKERKGSFQDLNALFVFGALTVLTIHILGFFIEDQQHYPWNYDFEALSIILLRFGRSLFIFATGMLLFYWYKHHQVDWTAFWKKRWKRIIIPYMIWTAIYTVFQLQTIDPAVVVPAFAHSLFTGSSFYHLYYIPLYLQLNLLFFVCKRFFERYLSMRLIVLLFLLQNGIYLVYRMLFVSPQAPQINWDASALLSLVQGSYVYGQSYLYMYLFYFALGAYAGLHVEKWRTWIYKLRYLSFAVLLATTAWIVKSYVTGEMSYQEGLNIFQPLYLVYTTSFIAAFYPVSSYIGSLPKVGDWFARIAKHNMAIYLVHPLILFLLESYVIFRLPWSTPVYVVAMFVVTPPLCIFLYEHVSISYWKERGRGNNQRKQHRPVIRTNQA